MLHKRLLRNSNRGLLPISLSLNVPSLVGDVGSVLTVPLLGAGANHQPTSTAASTPTAPTATAATGGGTASSGNTGSSSGAGSSSGNTGGGTTGSASGSSGSGNVGSNNGGSGSASSVGVVSPPASSPAAAAAGGAAAGGVAAANPSVAGQPQNSSPSTNPKSQESLVTVMINGSPIVQNAAVAATGSANGDVVIPVSTNADGVTIYATGAMVTNGVSPQPSSGVDSPGSSDPNNNSSPSGGSHKPFPAFAIGIIVAVVVILSLVGGICFIRMWHRRRRAARQTRWLPVMEEAAARSSTRSSFATNIDHGLRVMSPDANIPALPPAVTLADRVSACLDAQWLVVDAVNSKTPVVIERPLPSPISVRPFSPSESYSFPRPPSSHTSSEATHSNTALDDLHPPLPVDSPSDTVGKTLVKRPFAPSLPDELNVQPGEFVAIEDAFDDGWALIKRGDGTKGLIPLACFEENDSDVNLPQFLALYKRSSLKRPSTARGLAL